MTESLLKGILSFKIRVDYISKRRWKLKQNQNFFVFIFHVVYLFVKELSIWMAGREREGEVRQWDFPLHHWVTDEGTVVCHTFCCKFSSPETMRFRSFHLIAMISSLSILVNTKLSTCIFDLSFFHLNLALYYGRCGSGLLACALIHILVHILLSPPFLLQRAVFISQLSILHLKGDMV